MVLLQDSYSNGGPTTFEHYSSQRDVVYSLLLKSLINPQRHNIPAALAAVDLVDESRFSPADELKCMPYFTSRNLWGLFRRRTKLLCRKCGNYIGSTYEEGSSPIGSDNSDSSSGNSIGVPKKYNIRISALQPSSDDSGIS